ncbi:uncharacterized protein LOC143114916 [Alosa pseudoharengus]|uniref:uncharacterized protein LOC143114916 n=1 Tax=Alosa pseudoharengus TaxID=34774 RepID=UPI003F8A200E
MKCDSKRKYRNDPNHNLAVKKASVLKYKNNPNHRLAVKKASVLKYKNNPNHRLAVKKASVLKYKNNPNHRLAVKKASVLKYKTNLEHQTAVKKASKVKYSTNAQHRKSLKIHNRDKRQQCLANQKQFEKVMSAFLNKVKDGPNYVCCVCHRLLFNHQVKHCSKDAYTKTPNMRALAEKCITEDYLHKCGESCADQCQWLNSCRRQLWICHTCHSKLNRGQMPPESVHNNLSLSNIPMELSCLNNLEEHLIALHIPFMKMLALPKGGQNGVHGPVTCVPANIVETTNVLPRSDVDDSLLRVKLKRKLTYKGHYKYEYVNMQHVHQALAYLKKNNKYYTDIEFNDAWLNVFSKDDDEIMHEKDSTEPCASNNDDELLHDRQQHCMYMDTCLQPVDIGQEVLDHYLDSIVNVAPAEGNTPVKMLLDKSNEAKCFPALFPEGCNTYSDSREQRLTLCRYFNMRILNADGRFAENVEYIFYAQCLSEIEQVVSNVSIALRKGKGKAKAKVVDVDMLKDKESLTKLLQHDEGYRFLKPVRGSPAFWQGVQKDLFAMIRQLGIPTWFCSFSSADMRWTNLLSSILQQEGRTENVDTLEWADKCEMLRRNPVTAARMFDFRWHCFLKDVLMSPSHPIGKIVDYFYRVEFQQRGSPHVHCLFWVENAPQIDKNTDEEVVEFVDRYVTCETPCDDSVLLDIVSTVQQHSKRHSKTCKKKSTVCRFNFPRPPSGQTFICHKKEESDDEETCEDEKECECPLSQVCECPKPKKSNMRKDVAEDILGKVKTAIADVDKVYESVQDLFDTLGISQESYEMAYDTLGKKTQIVLKRQPADVWVNQYSKPLLKCWNANMDIQYVVDAYACIVYIISYISKAEREMGLLLSNAQKEASKERNLDAKGALKKLGSVYLHNRDVCAQEAVYRLTSMHLKECSRKVVFIPTGDNIVKMSLPLSVLRGQAESRDLSTDDMWMINTVDRYKNRPDEDVFNEMCLATFASEFRILSVSEKSANRVHLKNNMGFVLRRTRSAPAVVRYAGFSATKSPENFYHSMLQLFLPYRMDVQLKPPGYDRFEDFYNNGHVCYADGNLQSVKVIVDQNRNSFEVDADLLQAAEQEVNNGILEDAWCQLCPEQQVERLECEQVRIEQAQLVDDPAENIPDLADGDKQNLHLEKQKNSMCRAEGLALLRSLNVTQMSVFNQIRQWCLHKIQGKGPPPFHVFITGGAGTGKSHLIKAIQYEANRLLCRTSHNPDDLCVLLTAPTGIAAHNVRAATIHSAFCIGTNIKLPYSPLGEEKLNTLRSTLGNLQILIIDEISMVDHKLLAYIHGRLRQIKQTGNFSSFGNVSVIAVGDHYQLGPVRGTPLYVDNQGINLWKSHFSVVELCTIVRQKDTEFAHMLNRLRTRTRESPLLQSDIAVLKERETGEQSSALHIFPTNDQVQEHNTQRLIESCDEYMCVKAQDYKKDHKTGKVLLKSGQHCRVHNSSLSDHLYLADNARVMLIKNIDVEDGLVNGVCGTVTHIVKHEQNPFPLTVYVQFDDAQVGNHKRKQYVNENENLQNSTPIFPEEERVDNKGGIRRQFPLKLAWALTVHKVQSLTIDQAVVSLNKVFAAGQAYVALSRVKTLTGLIIQDFNEKAIYCKDKIQNTINEMPKFLCNTDLVKTMPNTFSLYLLNVQSLQAHIEDLTTCVETLSPSCVAVTETWLPYSFINDRVNIPNYDFHSSPRSLAYSEDNCQLNVIRKQQHGGVGVYTKRGSVYSKQNIPNLNLECSVLHYSDLDITLVVIYRPPSYPMTVFKHHLGNLLNLLSKMGDNIVVMGDFNEDSLKSNSLINFMATKQFTQIVSEPTTEAGTLIDHVYVKHTCMYTVIAKVMPVYFSTHEAILCTFSS